MSTIVQVNSTILTVVAALYAYQMVFIGIVIVGERIRRYRGAKPLKPVVPHRMAALISARNEAGVIGQLLDTINNQNYPEGMLQAIVIADNCTDDTAEVARAHGATVFERFNKQKVGKGYALDYAFKRIAELFGASYFDAYVIIDADNLLDENYFAEMNKTFCQGYRVMTSYRNSKNFSSNWISAGYALWFMREARFLNNARMMLGTSCAVSGTGFLVASEIIRERGGWNYHLLTEDIEFTVDSVIRGETIGYCAGAMLYDEQPTSFAQSWNQRLRWSKGFYQIDAKYGKRLARGVFESKKTNKLRATFSCFDLTMTVMPAMLLTIMVLAIDFGFLLWSIFGPIFMPHLMETMIEAISWWAITYYMTLFFVGTITTIFEWKRINCPVAKRIGYLFTFPIYMFTYIPIALAGLFGKVEWKPIQHSVAKTLDEVR